MFVDNENIRLVIHYQEDHDNENDYDDRNTANISTVVEATFTTPNSADKAAT